MCEVIDRQKENWLRNEDIERFPCQDLRNIDRLWVKYSHGRFGFSVQKNIWQECGSPTRYSKDWERFGDSVGWRVDGKWISLANVKHAASAPQGHLPIFPYFPPFKFWGLANSGFRDLFKATSSFFRYPECNFFSRNDL